MKTDFSIKWHLKVIKGQSFRVTGKPMRYFMTLHYNIGFNSKDSEDVTTEITKKIAGSDHRTVV